MTENVTEAQGVEEETPTAPIVEGEKEIAYRSEAAGARPAGEAGRQPVITAAAATGRRKEAIARVRIVPGSGNWTVNGKSLEEYFPNKVHQQIASEPFGTAGVEGAYDVIARINGGGISGQAGALRLGVARALNEADAEASRPSLKKAGMLSRDSRIKERKKAGLKKARKAPQYSKR